MKSDVLGLLLLLGILATVFAVVAGVQVWLRRSGVGQSGPGMVLLFEIDADSEAGAAADATRLLPMLDKRINPGWARRGRLTAPTARQVEIEIAGADQAAAQRIQYLVQTQGTLEFRILANPADHAPLVSQAKASPAAAVRDRTNQLLGWWVAVARWRERMPELGADTVTRHVKRNNQDVLEVLVVNDTFHLNGSHVAGAVAGQRSINLAFNPAGTAALSGLASTNVPAFAPGSQRRLGIILDGRLWAAPPIYSVLSGQAAIEGDFSPAEIEDLARILTAGALPVRLKRVEPGGRPPLGRATP